MSPTEIYDAKKVLDEANLEFDQRGDAEECRDLAYMASRNGCALAEVEARTEARIGQRWRKLVKAGVVVRDVQVKDTQVALASTREQLKQERQDNNAATNSCAANRAQGQELDRRPPARHREQARLSGEGGPGGRSEGSRRRRRREGRARGGSSLSLARSVRLRQVCPPGHGDVRRSIRSPRRSRRRTQRNAVVVEGRTDGQGSDGWNLPLSLTEEIPVRDYLVTRGSRTEKKITAGASARPSQSSTTSRRRSRQRSPRRYRDGTAPIARTLTRGTDTTMLPRHCSSPFPLVVRRVHDHEHAAERTIESSSAAILAAEGGGAAPQRRRGRYLLLARISTRVRRACRTRTTRPRRSSAATCAGGRRLWFALAGEHQKAAAQARSTK